MAAMAAHQNANHVDGHIETQALRETFEAMLEATQPFAEADGVPRAKFKEWRASGWANLAVLIADSQYSLDANRAERAQARIADEIQSCRSMVLGAG